MKFDEARRLPLSVVEIAVFLRMHPASIRSAIATHGIEPVGKQGRAKLYWTHEVTAAIGSHERSARRSG